MKYDASRLASPKRAPTRSRTRSNTGRCETVATRPAISAKITMPITPSATAHGCGHDVPDVEEAADRGQDAERDAQELLHPPCALTKRLSSRADLASLGSCLATSLKSA